MLHSDDKSILLLDEPTSHIDGESQDIVLENLFASATANNQTVLMVAHRLETAAKFCDKILVLDRGEVSAFDSGANLLLNSLSDSSVSKSDSLFAEMVLALTPSQQAKIVQFCKQKLI